MMKLPVISEESEKAYYPVDKICPICGADRDTLNSEFYVLNGGALKKENDEHFLINKNLVGFLNIAYHPAKNSEKPMKIIDIVSHSKNGQFDLYFCSTNCMRTFFDMIINEFEKK